MTDLPAVAAFDECINRVRTAEMTHHDAVELVQVCKALRDELLGKLAEARAEVERERKKRIASDLRYEMASRSSWPPGQLMSEESPAEEGTAPMTALAEVARLRWMLDAAMDEFCYAHCCKSSKEPWLADLARRYELDKEKTIGTSEPYRKEGGNEPSEES